MSEHGDKVADWLRSGRYLPAPLRDFHDQKEVFKTLWRGTAKRIASDPSCAAYLGRMTWTAAQVFVIDHFLWFMAAHGWTLQRARTKPADPFLDLAAAIKARRDEESEVFRKEWAERASQTGGTGPKENDRG